MPNTRLPSIVLAAALSACNRAPSPAPSTSVTPNAPLASAASSPASQATPEKSSAATPPAAGTLDIRDEPQRLEVTPLDPKAYRAATAPFTRADYDLTGSLGDFRVTNAKTKATVVARKGAFARWLTDTEVVFVEGGYVSKLDVRAPTKITRGGRTCSAPGAAARPLMPCEGAPAPMLAYVSDDLSHAIGQYPSPIPELVDFTSTGAKQLFDERVEHDGVPLVLARYAFEGDAVCALFGGPLVAVLSRSGTPPAPRAEPVVVRCAQPAWSTPRTIASFSAQGRLEEGFASVRWFSPRELLVSLRDAAARVPGAEYTYRHCIVAVADGTSRCTQASRRDWQPLHDGRWALEVADHRITANPNAMLVDIAHGRAFPFATSGYWSSPATDIHTPSRIVFGRTDKHDVTYGAVTKPTP